VESRHGEAVGAEACQRRSSLSRRERDKKELAMRRGRERGREWEEEDSGCSGGFGAIKGKWAACSVRRKRACG
jgi:hypothetical protein